MRSRKWMAGGLMAVLTGVFAAPGYAAHRPGRGVGVRISIGPTHFRGPAGFAPAFRYRPYHLFAPPYHPVVRLRPVHHGSVDFNVEPQNSRIYVDGAYLGIADDFNGYPQTAKLSTGYHNVRVVSPDGRTEERRIYVAAGEELNFNHRF